MCIGMCDQQRDCLDILRCVPTSCRLDMCASTCVPTRCSSRHVYRHMINKVLVPPSQRTVYQWADATPKNFIELTNAIDAAGLAEVLNGAGRSPYLRRTNAAFEAVFAPLRREDKADMQGEELQSTKIQRSCQESQQWQQDGAAGCAAQPHCLRDLDVAPEAGTKMKAVSGLEINVRLVNGKYYANEAEMSEDDRYTSSGATTRSIDGTNGLNLHCQERAPFQTANPKERHRSFCYRAQATGYVPRVRCGAHTREGAERCSQRG